MLQNERTPLTTSSSRGTDTFELIPQCLHSDKRREPVAAGHWQQSTLVFGMLLILYSVVIFLVGIFIGQNMTLPMDETRATSWVSPGAMSTVIVNDIQHPHKQELLLYPKISKHDFGPYKEFSVIHSDRSLNLMSPPFQQVMKDLNQLLKAAYHSEARVAIIPGSGTFGMESVARQFATNHHVLVLRNGYFSYRWTQIFDASQPAIPKSHTVLKALPILNNNKTLPEQQQMQYTPHPIKAVLATIQRERPAVVFAPHVETSTGIMLPDQYIRQIADQVHAVDGLLVLDCIASGTIWINMQDLGVDVVISAPQKDWTSPPSSALVVLSPRAVELVMNNSSSAAASFSLSLPDWLRVMEAYEQGSFAYHTTLPTDALREFQRVSVEILEFGLPKVKKVLTDLGRRVRSLLKSRGLTSVAAPGFEAPGVLVYYSPNNTANMVQAFQRHRLQIAKGVPWMIDEPENVQSFRIGLFGLDKLLKEWQTIGTLERALDQILDDL